jgi:hypothetical protein
VFTSGSHGGMMRCPLKDIDGAEDVIWVSFSGPTGMICWLLWMSAKCRAKLAISLLLAMVAGCGQSGPEVAPVSGRVTLDGQPLASADVSFQPDGAQRASSGRTNADGRYQLMFKRGQPGALVGAHTVRISVSRELVRNPPNIPARYDTQSELRREVTADEENVFDFELKSDAT